MITYLSLCLLTAVASECLPPAVDILLDVKPLVRIEAVEKKIILGRDKCAE